jgi:predicted nucleotidyltransferase
MIIPDMGTPRRDRTSSLAGALFTPVQQRVLGLLFGQPDRVFQSAEIIRLANSGTGAVHRQLQRLAEAGLVAVTRSGNQKHYQARRETPIFEELRGLVVKTVGIVEPMRKALLPHARKIRAAFVYGSVAKGTDTATSDIDLLVVSDSLEYPQVFEALQAAEAVLARPVQPTVLSQKEWRKQSRTSNSFAARIASQPRLFVLGTENDIS